jgi:phage terminase large subunit GpA-like protein
MVKIEADKSARWYSLHCAFCGKAFTPTENREKVTALFLDDSEAKVLMCEPCRKTAAIQQGCESVKKGVKAE